jgi:hypothetical protein
MDKHRRHLQVWPHFAQEQQKAGKPVPIDKRKDGKMLVRVVGETDNPKGWKLTDAGGDTDWRELEEVIEVEDWYGNSLINNGICEMVGEAPKEKPKARSPRKHAGDKATGKKKRKHADEPEDDEEEVEVEVDGEQEDEITP